VLVEVWATDDKTRENIVLAMQRKEKRCSISLWLNVSLSTIDKVWRKFGETGIYLPLPYTGRKSSLTFEQDQQIRAKIAQTPDITLNELREELSLDLSESGLSLYLKKMGLSLKKDASCKWPKTSRCNQRAPRLARAANYL
jgi:transposase